MRAAVYNPDGSLKLVERDLTEPEPGWALVKVSAVGICGTDLHIRNGALGAPTGIQPGHEVTGVVDRIGEDTGMKEGTNVVLEPVLGCGDCRYCNSGLSNRCQGKRFFGHTLHGGMADSFLVNASLLYPVNPGLAPAIAALVEPAAVCVRGVRRGKVNTGVKVAIIGAGTIGLLSILAAQHMGASEVHICARHPHQQDMAHHLGATRVYSNFSTLIDTLGDDYIDVVIESVGGTAETLGNAVEVATTGGTVVMLGAYVSDPRLPALRFMTRELSLVASNCHAHDGDRSDMDVAIELVSNQSHLLAPLVTHSFKLDQVGEAFRTAEDKDSKSIKVQVCP